MWGVLRRPRWLAYLAVAVVFGVITFLLGQWQWDRHQGKVERRDLIEANYDRDPVPFEEVLSPGEDLAGADGWARVEARGRYLTDDTQLARNRPWNGVYGYEVIVPLETDDGRVLAVDRGWVPNADRASDLPEVPAPPEGTVDVVGWLRPGEPDLERDMPDGQLASIDLDRISAAVGEPVEGAYLLMDSETPEDAAAAVAERPEALPPPDTGLGSHFAYALQWWITVPVGVILVMVMARREAEDEAAEAAAATEGSAPPAKNPKPTQPKKKRRRIWDDEDWDDEDVIAAEEAQARR